MDLCRFRYRYIDVDIDIDIDVYVYMCIYIYIYLLISRTCILIFCLPYITWYMEICIHSQVEVYEYMEVM